MRKRPFPLLLNQFVRSSTQVTGYATNRELRELPIRIVYGAGVRTKGMLT